MQRANKNMLLLNKLCAICDNNYSVVEFPLRIPYFGGKINEVIGEILGFCHARKAENRIGATLN